MADTRNPMMTSHERSTPSAPATDVRHKAEQAAGAGVQKAKDVASSLTDKAKDAASSVAHQISDAASNVGEKAAEATSAIGSGMKSLAGTIREKAPHEGMLGSCSTAVAETLESGGRYLQDEGLRGMAEDLTHVIRRNPLASILAGIGIGFCLARLTSRS